LLIGCSTAADTQRTLQHDGALSDINDWCANRGDEFALALPGIATTDSVQVVAQRVQVALARPFVFAEQEIPLSATMA